MKTKKKPEIGSNAWLKKVHEDVAVEFAEWLNRPEQTFSPAALIQVQEMKAALACLTDLMGRAERREWFHPDEMKPLNDALARYKWITQYVPTVAGGYSDLYSQHVAVLDDVPEADTGMEKDDPRWEQVQAHQWSTMLVDLLRYGLLERMRRCLYCNQWILAKRHDCFYCSSPHQQAAFKKRPEFKKHAKEYQKKYYRDVLSPVTGRVKKGRGRKNRRKIR